MRKLRMILLSLAFTAYAGSAMAVTIKISTTVPETSNWMVYLASKI